MEIGEITDNWNSEEQIRIITTYTKKLKGTNCTESDINTLGLRLQYVNKSN